MTGLIILAAGESKRLGKPKQNLMYNGKTLLQHAVSAAICSVCRPIIVVLGANSESIMPEIEGHYIQLIHNPDWQQGMSTSIKSGVAQLQNTPGIDSAIIMLCDQPFADDALIANILETHAQSRKGIVACAYNNTLGVPVFFAQQYFEPLLNLQGHEGAKKLLAVYTDDIAEVSFAKGEVDIDTMSDYEGLVG